MILTTAGAVVHVNAVLVMAGLIDVDARSAEVLGLRTRPLALTTVTTSATSSILITLTLAGLIAHTLSRCRRCASGKWHDRDTRHGGVGVLAPDELAFDRVI